MSVTALIELRDALGNLLGNDPTLDAMLSGRKVYALQATGSLNYIVIGPTIIDRPGGHFNQRGRYHRRRLTGWARSTETAENIYARLVALLDDKILSLDGHAMEHSTLSFLAGPREDTDRKAWGVDAEWTVSTLEGI
jgi:hypothetical protein